ncbi:PD-(D/E)XK nuclease family protein, partial [Rhizobium ruizarguesonis]
EYRRYAVSGRIDRLAVLADRFVILDYNTNRVPPATEEAIPFAHRAQLAIYREILAPLYPDKRIDCKRQTERLFDQRVERSVLGIDKHAIDPLIRIERRQ